MATIQAALESVRAQTFTDWEMVVCDDGSDDGSTELIHEAIRADARIRMVVSSERSGPATARNTAITLARGDNVAFLDADDVLEPTYLEEMLAKLEAAGPNTGIVCCDAWLVDATGSVLGRWSDSVGRADGLDLAGLLRSNRIFVASLCPRRVIEAAGGFFPEMVAEDYDLWIRICELGYDVAQVAAPLVRYRVDPNSLSASRSRMAIGDQLVFQRALTRGNLDGRERRIAQARLDLARAALATSGGIGPSALRPLIRAIRARARLAYMR